MLTQRISARASLILGALLFTGCMQPRLRPETTGQTPLVRVGLSGDYPPFCELSQRPEAWQGQVGFDIELLRRLSADLGWREVQPVRFVWPELAALLVQGQADVAACGITIRRDRAPRMLFTRPYAISGAVAAIRPDTAGRFPDVAALDRPGMRLAVNAGGHLEKVVRERFAKARIQTVTDNRTLRAELDKGAADAIISDSYEASRWSDLAILGPFTRDLKALALPLDQRERRDAVNAWLAAREADGWLPAQRRQLDVAAADIGPAELCAEALGSAIELRFSLMPLVAAVKRRDGLPITDPAQEAAVLQRASNVAERLGLSVNAATELFTWLMVEAKRIQSQSRVEAVSGMTLAGLRGAVAGTSDALLPEIGRCQRVLAGQGELLERVLRNRVGDWLDTDQIKHLLERLPPQRDFSGSRCCPVWKPKARTDQFPAPYQGIPSGSMNLIFRQDTERFLFAVVHNDRPVGLIVGEAPDQPAY